MIGAVRSTSLEAISDSEPEGMFSLPLDLRSSGVLWLGDGNRNGEKDICTTCVIGSWGVLNKHEAF